MNILPNGLANYLCRVTKANSKLITSSDALMEDWYADVYYKLNPWVDSKGKNNTHSMQDSNSTLTTNFLK